MFSLGGLRLGKLWGIPIRIDLSFLFLMAIYVVTRGLSGVVLLLLTFASVLVHELGHALVARRYKVPILGIDLHFFGGTAKMARMPSSSREELFIAAAGPAVSFAIALLGFLLYLPTRFSGFLHLAAINLALGVFNLVPALPMDGGRIFRALLAPRLGRLRATVIAVRVARVVAVGLALLGLYWFNFFLFLLAILLWSMGSAELRAAQLWHAHAASPGPGSGAVEVLDRDGRSIGGAPAPGTISIEEQQGPGTRRWIVRGPDGRVLFVAEQPLRW